VRSGAQCRDRSAIYAAALRNRETAEEGSHRKTNWMLTGAAAARRGAGLAAGPPLDWLMRSSVTGADRVRMHIAHV